MEINFHSEPFSISGVLHKISVMLLILETGICTIYNDVAS